VGLARRWRGLVSFREIVVFFLIGAGIAGALVAGVDAAGVTGSPSLLRHARA
jgi:hypothetical protein